jgi:aspartate/methionine/tyrosine aminotransferase
MRSVTIKEDTPPTVDVEFCTRILRTGIKGLKPLGFPDSGFFQLFDFSEFRGKYYGNKCIKDGIDLYEALVTDCGVSVLPGELFAYNGPEMVGRISYSLPEHKIVEGMFRIAKFTEKLKDYPYELPEPALKAGRTL